MDSYNSQEGRSVEELKALIKKVLQNNFQAFEEVKLAILVYQQINNTYFRLGQRFYFVSCQATVITWMNLGGFITERSKFPFGQSQNVY